MSGVMASAIAGGSGTPAGPGPLALPSSGTARLSTHPMSSQPELVITCPPRTVAAASRPKIKNRISFTTPLLWLRFIQNVSLRVQADRLASNTRDLLQPTVRVVGEVGALSTLERVRRRRVHSPQDFPAVQHSVPAGVGLIGQRM